MQNEWEQMENCIIELLFVELRSQKNAFFTTRQVKLNLSIDVTSHMVGKAIPYSLCALSVQMKTKLVAMRRNNMNGSFGI